MHKRPVRRSLIHSHMSTRFGDGLDDAKKAVWHCLFLVSFVWSLDEGATGVCSTESAVNSLVLGLVRRSSALCCYGGKRYALPPRNSVVA